MNKTKILGLAIATLVASAATSAWSQPQQSASAPAGAQEAVAPGAVAPTGKRADRTLRRKVYAAIGKDKAINAGDISVRAKNGAVTLSGSVSDAAQVARVQEIASGVPGVTSVTNKLTVKKSFGGM
jgi:hyperosmotically inducible periplasmic protein